MPLLNQVNWYDISWADDFTGNRPIIQSRPNHLHLYPRCAWWSPFWAYIYYGCFCAQCTSHLMAGKYFYRIYLVSIPTRKNRLLYHVPFIEALIIYAQKVLLCACAWYILVAHFKANSTILSHRAGVLAKSGTQYNDVTIYHLKSYCSSHECYHQCTMYSNWILGLMHFSTVTMLHIVVSLKCGWNYVHLHCNVYKWIGEIVGEIFCFVESLKRCSGCA